VNDGYADFDAFLATLSSRKRKNIRKERAQANGFGGEIMELTGDAIQPEHWDAFWRFYQDTGNRKWGTPYLTRAFFDHAQEFLRDDILLVRKRYMGAIGAVLNTTPACTSSCVITAQSIMRSGTNWRGSRQARRARLRC